MATEEAERPSQQVEGDGLNRSEQATAISRSMVGLLRRLTGRGPTRARTTIGRDHVLVMFEDSLSEGERTLVQEGHRDDVAAMRRAYQEAMETEASNLVSEITGRQVSRFMSANHLDAPDMAAEVFVFEPDGAGDQQPQEAEHREEPSDRL